MRRCLLACALIACALVGVLAELPSEMTNEPLAAFPDHEPLAASASPSSSLASSSIDTESSTPDIALAQITQTVEGPTGRRPTAPGNKQPKDKLDIALAAIKQDIMVRNRQLEEEKNWVEEVHKITEQYNKKVHRVESDIVKTRNEVKSLFKKKKQVENLKIQRALEAKLKDATADLSTLQQALHHVKSKSQEFEKTKDEIKRTIYGIHTQLSKLRGEKPKVKAPTDL